MKLLKGTFFCLLFPIFSCHIDPISDDQGLASDLDFDLFQDEIEDRRQKISNVAKSVKNGASSLLEIEQELASDIILGDVGEDVEEEDSVGVDFKCMVCHWGANILVDYAKHGKTIQEFISVTARLCSFFGIEKGVRKKWGIILIIC